MASGTIYRCLQDPDLDLVIHPGDLGYAMGFGLGKFLKGSNFM
jgi:hypothetical protein